MILSKHKSAQTDKYNLSCKYSMQVFLSILFQFSEIPWHFIYSFEKNIPLWSVENKQQMLPKNQQPS